MITSFNIPDNEDHEEAKPVHDNTVDNSNNSANDNDSDSDMERYEQATEASEPSFTIETDEDAVEDGDGPHE